MRITLVLLFLPALMLGQQEIERKSIHQLESELHQKDMVSEAPEHQNARPGIPRLAQVSQLSKKVYGWHPYWASSSAYVTYDYAALTHIAHFSYETDTATGGYLTTRGWETSPVIDYAHQQGVKVTLTVTNFGLDRNDKLLSDTVKQQRMINTLIALLKMRNGDGVNFDLESVRSTQRSNLVSFMRRAATQIKAQVPEAEISMATPSVDWSGSWDFAQLAEICDYLVVMGYGYYYSESTTAGPVAPLEGENYNITRTINTYLGLGVPPAKLLLGVPWYGYDWPVQSSVRKSSATGTASSKTYAVAEQMASLYGKTLDVLTKVPWFSYQGSSGWRQVWYDDTASLAAKYALVNSRALGGIGIWALSYDGARKEIWNGIKSAFSTTGVEQGMDLARRFELSQNYPNPFNPSTSFEFRVPSFSAKGGSASGGEFVSLKVLDVLGRVVATPVNEYRQPGHHSIRWNASGLPSGVYFYRMQVGGFVETRKMILSK